MKPIHFALAALLPSLLVAQSPPSLPAAVDFATQVMEATFKVENDGHAATCFLVRRAAPDQALYLVTAAHVMESNTGETAVLVLRKPKPDGSYERCDYNLPVRQGDKPLWVRGEKQDVAVLRISQPLPVSVAAVPLSALADETSLRASAVHLCSPLFVLGYPQGLESDESGSPVARQGVFASPPQLPSATHPTFFADYNATPGDSGGPVFISGADNRPLLVGVVSDQKQWVEDLKGAYQDVTIRSPLGVAIIVRTNYVRDAIEAAAKHNELSSK